MASSILRKVAAGVVAMAFATQFADVPLANAQGISDRTITIMVPNSAGTGNDTIARLIGDQLSAKWNQPVIIRNEPGASGMIGTAQIARANPDGHEILFTATSYALNVVLSQQLPYDPNDFRGLMETARATWSLAVNPSFPAETVQEFVEHVRANPGSVDYASPGFGTPHFLVMEMLKLDQQLDMVHIPYPGQSEAVLDVLSGQVPVMAFPTHVALPLANDGRLRMLAVFADERVATKPDMPTMAEEGYPLKLDVWYGFLAPARMSDELVEKYNTTLNEIIAIPEVQEALGRQGLRVMGGTPEAFDQLIAEQIQELGELVEEANIPRR